ncbi:efflux RND transporter periplasmic adaptor subunit [Pelotalea chapellei]|uniref:Efflux RND transporter periplasmic adaptor subunit n=1 Tax=Pelotalea chapellei TaxID=44671 RepID=A0ABS5UBZ3_9BACT|nr:efflux RND transporter periplasmic adaptor subunit [Pelotalea chapellei]MBT1073179.1 efflux RND transporter periplasmic adaptor subunit [Pelotalea chapellei]
MRKILLITIAVAIIAVVTIAIIRRKPEETNRLKVSGTIEVTSTELSFKIPGRMMERLVDEGEIVRRGQVVARLDTEELHNERSARLADQRAAQAGLADLRAGSRREEIAQGKAALARMRAEADRSVSDARRMEELFRREVIPLKDLEAARAARDASAAAVREAQERLKLLESGPRPNAVQEMGARAEATKAALAQAETRLSQSVLTSPVNGLVLSKHAEPGEMVAAGGAIVTVGTMDQVWLRGYIPEYELGKVKVGQPASVTVDTWPGRTFQGTISFISPQAEFTPKNVQTEKERVKLVYRIKITMANPQMELKPGMPADAVISIDSKPR